MPDEVMRESDVSPRGSAGLANQGSTGTVDLVGPVYSDLAAATEAAAMDKRQSDWSTLMSGNTPAAGGESSSY